MLTPAGYMSRLAIPAMITSTDGTVIYENPPVRGFISAHYRKRFLLCLDCDEYDMLLTDSLPEDGSIFTLHMGRRDEKVLIIRDGSNLKWYFPAILSERPPVTLPGICLSWVAHYASEAERTILSGIERGVPELFANAAYSAFLGFRPPTRLTAYDLCRMISLSSHYLVCRDRFLYPAAESFDMFLKHPEKAFEAAGKMIGLLLEKRNAEWHFAAENNSGILTDGNVSFSAGEYTMIRRPHTLITNGAFSLLTAVTFASAVSAAEMGIFREAKTSGKMTEQPLR